MLDIKFTSLSPHQKPTTGIPIMEGDNVYRRLTGNGSPKPRCGVVFQAAWHWGGDGSAANDLLRAPGSTSLYLCLPPKRGPAGGYNYFPITWTHVEKTQNKKTSRKQGHWYRSTCLVLLNKGSSSLANHPRELVFRANLGTLSI